MDYENFVNCEKALLVAPAGYGKTHTLAKCLEFTTGKSLILTHTHAGIASIKQKLKNAAIHSRRYSVETITSFAQRYVESFYIGDEKPLQEDTTNYYPFIISEAAKILSTPQIKNVLLATYSGVFVDEYQDCSRGQHSMIRKLIELFPTRVLGDPLQGIFDFNGELVNFDEDLADFKTFPTLDVPHRWNQVGAEGLGLALAEIRENLENGKPIDLRNFEESIEVTIASEQDFYKFKSDYVRALNSLRDEDSLLVIHPNSMNKQPRIKFSKRFKDIRLLESIDDSDFYSLAKSLDKFNLQNPLPHIRNISLELFNKTGVNEWFNEKGFKNKKDKSSKKRITILQKLVANLESLHDVIEILNEIEGLPNIYCSRKELLRSISKAIELSVKNNTSVLVGMREQRNNIRRLGRRVEGKHVGTTLLTKGLEFDVVVVLDAHKIQSPKHLYVALTRCRKKLVVISASNVLNPYK